VNDKTVTKQKFDLLVASQLKMPNNSFTWRIHQTGIQDLVFINNFYDGVSFNLFSCFNPLDQVKSKGNLQYSLSSIWIFFIPTNKGLVIGEDVNFKGEDS